MGQSPSLVTKLGETAQLSFRSRGKTYTTQVTFSGGPKLGFDRKQRGELRSS